MRKFFLFAFVWIAASESSTAQLFSFLTMDSVDINNINAMVLVHGDMWWNPALGEAHCRFPKGSNKNISFNGALWMSAYDAANTLHAAAQTYRQAGNDYWPGPLDTNDTLTYATSQDWAKIWKINRTDIQYFRSLASHNVTNTPAEILSWPGSGNTYARGNGGAVLAMVAGNSYAPFVDLNADGVYQPLMGEYPDIKGDQALWYVFSDNGPVHSESQGRPLGVEIQTMIYAYSRGTLIDNVVYYDYNIINRGPNTYHDFRIGQYVDMDLGYYNDDYIGFDSTHRMGITYNGNTDDGGSAGSPVGSYGTNIPVAGISLIVLPGDVGLSHVPAGSFTYYNNDFSMVGNPSIDTEYNFYLRSKLRSGAHFTNDFSGPSIPSIAYGSGPNTDYVFPGDPAVTSQWSECAANNIPGDRRFIISSNDFNLPSGATQHVVMALVTTNPAAENGCPTVGFTDIKKVADTAWNIFYNPLPPLPYHTASVNHNPDSRLVSIYPNPASDVLYIDANASGVGIESITVSNPVGQEIPVPVYNDNGRIVLNIMKLNPGSYYLRYTEVGYPKSTIFTKK